MRRTIYFILVIFIFTSLSCQRSPYREDTLTQVSTIDALLCGDYDGKISYGEIKKYGDFGLGTFDALDGEMVAFEGSFYQVKGDGNVYPVSSSLKTPFACVTFFHKDMEMELPCGIDYSKLKDLINNKIPTKNIFFAIRIDGEFSYVKTRSVPAQKKPYPPITEVTKNQPIFEFNHVKGTLVGFRCPEFVKGINVAGFHLHFLTEDKTGGGHILEFTLKEGTLLIDDTSSFFLILPREETFYSLDLTKDRQIDINKVERE